LVRDALKLRAADSLLQLQSSRIVLLENKQQSLSLSYTNLLKIEQDKYNLQKETTGDMERLAYSFRDQMNYYKKKEKRSRWQRNGLGALLVGVVVYSLVK
jgi:hypothetical protein